MFGSLESHDFLVLVTAIFSKIIIPFNFLIEVLCSHVRRLIQKGADAALINSSGELPIDLAEEESVSAVLRHSIQEKDIDVEEARDREHRRMLDDICELRKQTRAGLKAADFAPISEPTTQATPLHVASAKVGPFVMTLSCCLSRRETELSECRKSQAQDSIVSDQMSSFKSGKYGGSINLAEDLKR